MNRRLSLNEWKDIFRNIAEASEEEHEEFGDDVEVIYLDAVPYDEYGNPPTGERKEWIIGYGYEAFEDGFQTEEEAQERLNIIKEALRK
jgi:hypothetical protein